MSNKTDTVKRCEEWIGAFSWIAFHENRDDVLERLPDVTYLGVKILTSLRRLA